MDWPNATDQAHPCRPTVSCTADIVGPGRLEVEGGVQYSGNADGSSRAFAAPFLLKQSFTRFVQLQVGSNGYTFVPGAPSAKYLDNLIVGPKLHLHDQGDLWPSLAVSAQWSLPTFQEEGYPRQNDVFVTAYASKDVSFLHFDWNVGGLFWAVDETPASQVFTALAVSPSLPSPFGVAFEGYYFSDAPPVAPHDGGVRIAGSLTPRPWLVMDIGGDMGFFPSTRAVTLFAGLTMIPMVFR